MNLRTFCLLGVALLHTIAYTKVAVAVNVVSVASVASATSASSASSATSALEAHHQAQARWTQAQTAHELELKQCDQTMNSSLCRESAVRKFRAQSPKYRSDLQQTRQMIRQARAMERSERQAKAAQSRAQVSELNGEKHLALRERQARKMHEHQQRQINRGGTAQLEKQARQRERYERKLARFEAKTKANAQVSRQAQ